MSEINIDEFIQDIAKAAAKQMRKVGNSQVDQACAMVRLQDATSLYSPMCWYLIQEELKGADSGTQKSQ